MKPNIQIRKAIQEDNDEVTAFAFEIMRSLGVKPDPENIDYALVATFGKEREVPLGDFVAVDGELPVVGKWGQIFILDTSCRSETGTDHDHRFP